MLQFGPGYSALATALTSMARHRAAQPIAAGVGVAIGGTLFFGFLQIGMADAELLADYVHAFDVALASMIALLVASSLLSRGLPKIEGFLNPVWPPRAADMGVAPEDTVHETRY